MALSFDGVQPVKFGGKECTPKIDTETKMRLADIKKYDSEADRVLAAAFPNDEEYVYKFLKEKMTLLDKETLHGYLIGGDTMVETIKNEIHNTIKEASKK